MRRSNRLIAICGGIASGKSAVCQVVKGLGGCVISSDEINKEMLSDPAYITLLEGTFNGMVQDGIVNRSRLRELIVTDSNAKAKLDAIAHPRIRARIMDIAEKTDGDVFVEVPLLKGSGMGAEFDEVWFVLAPHDNRIRLLMARDNLARHKAELIIALQAAEDELQYTATRIIVNDGTYNQLCLRVEEAYYSIQ